MKFFFLLIVLANIFVFLWEYRYGNTYAPPKAAASLEQSTPGLEKIRLVSEVPPKHTETGPPPEENKNPLDSATPKEIQNPETPSQN